MASTSDAIAIIGMHGRFPGSPTLEDFWRNLRHGVDCVSTFSEAELRAAGVDPERLADPRYVRAGGILEDIDRFDAAFFGFSTHEAELLDPQHRLFFECVWSAFEDAACNPERFDGSIGIFAGSAISNYLLFNLHASLDHAGSGRHLLTMMGNDKDYLATHVAYKLNLTGPCVNVQTACSTSLVAVHLACQSLLNRECDLALAGGVTVRVPQKTGYLRDEGSILSADGKCRSFDAAATGTVFGSGAGVVVLRRLDEALAAGDRIRAIILGSAINNDGARKVGYTAPSVDGEAAVIAEALAVANVTPESIAYIEAHGTGTPLGDPIEMAALSEVFHDAPIGSCAVGTVKSNIGHLEVAAGIAGLIKVVLALEHQAMPASLHYTRPNPRIDFAASPFYVNTRFTPWQSAGPRRAGVSSFGIGGTNAHVVVQEAPSVAPVVTAVERPLHLLCLSARSQPALQDMVQRYQDALQNPPASLADMCYTAGTGRPHFRHRVAVVAATAAETREKLATLTADGTTASQGDAPAVPQVAFLFTGQGSQYLGMGRELYQTQPRFRAFLERCDATLRPLLERPLLSVMFEAEGAIDQTLYTQPALFALQMALADLWRSWGIVPGAVLGHSVGEYAAACVAGVFECEAGLHLMATRGRLMQALPERGTMAAVFAEFDTVQQAVAEAGAGRVSVAAENGPRHTVISGDTSAVDRVLHRLRERGVDWRPLAVSQAFHSPLLEPILDALERAAALPYREASVPVMANLSGQERRVFDAAYWRQQARQPVKFAAGLQQLVEQGYNTFVEIGPHPVLITLGRAGVSDGVWVPSLRRGAADWHTLLEGLGRLYTGGAAIDWEGFHSGSARRKVALPHYPFQRRRYWIDPPRVSHSRRPAGHPLLGNTLSTALQETIYEARLAADTPAWLGEHRVHGLVLLPAAGYLEMALAMGYEAVENFTIHEALLLPEGEERTVQCIRDPGGSFRVFSQEGEHWRQHASGRLTRGTATPERVSMAALRSRCQAEIAGEDYYRRLSAAGLEPGPSLQAITRLWHGPGEAVAALQLPEAVVADKGGYRLHPILLDAGFQTLGAALPEAQSGASFVPVSLDRLQYLGGMERCCWSHATLHPDQLPGAEIISGDIRLLDEDGQVIAQVTGLHCRRLRPELLRQDAGSAAHLYHLAWRPAPLATLPDWPRPAVVAAAVRPVLELLRHDAELARYRAFVPAAEALAVEFAVAALEVLHCRFEPGRPLIVDGVAPQHQRLLARILEMLMEEGIVCPQGTGWTTLRRPGPVAPQQRCATLMAQHPEQAAELSLLARCGEALASVLHGDTDPLHLLFPSAGPGAAAIYRDAPMARAMHTLSTAVLQEALAHVPAGRRLRILEVGAGTGATTAAVLPLLPPDRTDYVFTDVSPVFLRQAEGTFSSYACLRTQLFDVEVDPRLQGFEDGTFDLVLAANVLHATADLRRSLEHARRLLAPGGLLVLVEGVGKVRWLDLVFGLTEGWWKFQDTDVRPSYPLLPLERWLTLLKACDYTDVEALTLHGEDAAQQVLLLARAPAQRQEGTWLVVADGGELCHALAERLQADGAQVLLADPHAALPEQPLQGVVCLAGLDTTPVPETTAESLRVDRTRGVTHVLHLVQALSARPDAPRLLLASCGAQPVQAGDSPAVAPAYLWGLARVIALELPQLNCRIIDLDPTADISTLAEALRAEVLAVHTDSQVAWRQGQRFAAHLIHQGAGEGRLSVPPTPFHLENRTPGVLDGLTLVSTPRVAPGPGEVEVQVVASGLNFKDVLTTLDLVEETAPLGGECAGRVIALGEGVEGVSPGDEVIAVAGGGLASSIVVPAALLALKPPGMSFEQAAALPIATVTAWYALRHLAGLASGERVLIHAASGGVGQAAVSIARQVGAEIFATAGSPEKRAFLRAQGIRHVLDSRSTGFGEAILAATGGAGVDVVLNALPGDFVAASLQALKANGRFLEIGRLGTWTAAQVAAIRPHAAYFPIALDRVHATLFGTLLQEVLAAYRDGTLTPAPLHIFPLESAPEAFRLMQQAGHIGKIVLTQRHLQPVVRADASYLITGGLGGLGLTVAAWLVDKGARHLVLVGRRQPDQPASAVVEQLQWQGVEVCVMQADVSQASEVARVLAEIRHSLPPLRGVIHAAGVLADALLQDQNVARFEAVMGPKADGAWHLHRLAGDLDFFVLFASAAGVLGSAGQGNHAAANAFLDALAHLRRRQGLPATSIDWGAWSGVGAASRLQVEEQLRGTGMGTISSAQGLAALEQIVHGSHPQVAVLPIDWPVLLARYNDTAVPSLFAEMVATAPPVATGEAASLTDFLTRLRQAPSNSRYELLLTRVTALAHSMLDLAPDDELDPARPLNEYGLDSLMVVEMRNRLSSLVNVDLPATLLFSYPSLAALTDYLADEVLGLAKPAPPAPDHLPDPLVDEVKNLSEDELDSILQDFAREHLEEQ